MNIIVSLIPPKLMKLANLFGFHGTRKVGLQALEFSSHSQDMKAPLVHRYEPFSHSHYSQQQLSLSVAMSCYRHVSPKVYVSVLYYINTVNTVLLVSILLQLQM